MKLIIEQLKKINNPKDTQYIIKVVNNFTRGIIIKSHSGVF